MERELATKSFGYFRKFFHGGLSIFSSLFFVLPYVLLSRGNKKKVTEQYPDTTSSRSEEDLPAKSRGVLFNDVDKCTGCGDCRKICPVRCIEISTEVVSSSERLWVSKFDIDLGKCIFCGLCVDACEPESLVHSRRFEAAAYETSGLILSYGKGGLRGDGYD